MTSKTVRQKFLYSVPHFDSGLPMVKTFKIETLEGKAAIITFSHLHKLSLGDLKKSLENYHLQKICNIIIKNDLILYSESKIIEDAVNHDILVFAYWFQKSNFMVYIQ